MKPFSFILLLLLFLFQSPVGAQNKQAARNKLKEMNSAFTSDAFIQSVIEGNKAKVEVFLAAGMSVNSTYKGEVLTVANRVIEDGQTALLIALCIGHNEIASLLLAKGADVNQVGNNGAFPLLVATGPLAKELLDRGADVNQRADYGQTALMEAAANGDLEKIALLLHHGADVNAKNQGGFSALRIAVAQRQQETVKLLIESGADLSDFSERAIRLMTSEPEQDDEVMQLFGKLYGTKNGLSKTGPSLEDQRQVPARLLEIAHESAESRAKVIERLIDVVEDPAAQDEWPIATAWMTAVDLLGALRATEAMDVLVENLNRTGQNGIILSIHIRPVYSALVKIGEPAVPKLIEALSHPKPSIRTEAAWLLFTILKNKARAALEAAYQIEKDEEVKKAFKNVIDRIEQGGY